MVTEFLQLFFTVLIILDPIGIIPPFFAATAQFDAKMRNSIIKRAIFVSSFVFIFFICLGRIILDFFGISPGAFYVSGGILFFAIAYGMIWSKPSSRQTPESSVDPQEAKMIAVFPLAIPLIAGPGMITTIMLNMTASSNWIQSAIMLSLAISLGLLIDFISLRGGAILLRLIGTTGMYVIEKIMGLILTGLAVQLIFDGLVKLGIVVV